MAHYEDLSNYNYHHFSQKEFNIGWLEKDQPFPIGEIPEGFLEKLDLYLTREFTVFHYRGDHDCQFCNKRDSANCEIRVVSTTGKIYAAPELIKHYIIDHKYLPPQEFIDAVMTGPTPGSDKYKEVIALMPTFFETKQRDEKEDNYYEKIQNEMADALAESVNQKILKDILEKSPNFEKFVESYGKIIPAVYGVNSKKKKKK